MEQEYYILQMNVNLDRCTGVFTITKNSSLVTGVFEMFFGVMLLAKKPADWLKKGINAFLLAVFQETFTWQRKQLPLGK